MRCVCCVLLLSSVVTRVAHVFLSIIDAAVVEEGVEEEEGTGAGTGTWTWEGEGSEEEDDGADSRLVGTIGRTDGDELEAG